MPSVFILPSFGVVYGFGFHVAHGDLWWMRGAFCGIDMAATAGITWRHARDAWTMGPSGPWRCIARSVTVIPPWPLNELSFDVGIRHGLSDAAPNWGCTAGLTFAFPWDLAEEKRP